MLVPFRFYASSIEQTVICSEFNESATADYKQNKEHD